MVACHVIVTRATIAALEKKRDRLLARIRAQSDVLKGSLAEVRLTCGREGCRCRKEKEGRHVAYHFSYRVGGKARSICVRKSWLPEFQQRHAAWLELKRILEELTEVLIELYRAQPRAEKRPEKGKRPWKEAIASAKKR